MRDIGEQGNESTVGVVDEEKIVIVVHKLS